MKRFLTILSLALVLALCAGTLALAETNYVCPENAQTYPISEEKITVEL